MIPVQMQTFGVRTLLGSQADALYSPTPIEDAIVTHGDFSRLSLLTDIPALRSANAAMAAWDGELKTVRAWSPLDGPSYEIFPTREQLGTLYDAGCTIVLENVERFVQELRPLCRALERDLSVPVGRVNVEIFCAQGVGHGRPHFDRSFTFNCQLQGNKTWRIKRHESLKFPTTGMFLGRSPELDLLRIMDKPIPVTMGECESVIAVPGSVVFLPPGVLHETNTDTGSYAIAFAIEQTDSLAELIAHEVRIDLQKVIDLRAPRLGAQFLDVNRELGIAATTLRTIANEIEGRTWPHPEPRFKLRTGLNVETESSTRVRLRGPRAVRLFTLSELQVTLLVWASTKSSFSIGDLASDLPLLDFARVEKYLNHLVNLGLMERGL